MSYFFGIIIGSFIGYFLAVALLWRLQRDWQIRKIDELVRYYLMDLEEFEDEDCRCEYYIRAELKRQAVEDCLQAFNEWKPEVSKVKITADKPRERRKPVFGPAERKRRSEWAKQQNRKGGKFGKNAKKAAKHRQSA